MTKKSETVENPLEVKIVDTNHPNVYGVLGISEERIHSFVEPLAKCTKKIFMTKGYYPSEALAELSPLCKDANELSYVSYLLGKGVAEMMNDPQVKAMLAMGRLINSLG